MSTEPGAGTVTANELLVQRNGRVSIRGVFGLIGAVTRDGDRWSASCDCGWNADTSRSTRKEAVDDFLTHWNTASC